MVSENASMALDDYIAKTKIGKGGRGGGGGRGKSRDGGNRGNRDRGGDRGRIQKRRNDSHDDRGGFRRGRNMDDAWEHDMYKGPRGGGRASAKLLVDNLDFGVTDEDMQELFGEFGNLRKAVILYDRSGRSTGQAEVEFSSQADAEDARNQYNGVPLDGRAMKISVVQSEGGGARGRLGQRVSSGGRGGRGGGRSRSRSPRGNRGRGNRGGGRGGGNRGGGRREPREKKEEVTQEQLDKEMDEYLSQKK